MNNYIFTIRHAPTRCIRHDKTGSKDILVLRGSAFLSVLDLFVGMGMTNAGPSQSRSNKHEKIVRNVFLHASRHSFGEVYEVCWFLLGGCNRLARKLAHAGFDRTGDCPREPRKGCCVCVPFCLLACLHARTLSPLLQDVTACWLMTVGR